MVRLVSDGSATGARLFNEAGEDISRALRAYAANIRLGSCVPPEIQIDVVGAVDVAGRPTYRLPDPGTGELKVVSVVHFDDGTTATF